MRVIFGDKRYATRLVNSFIALDKGGGGGHGADGDGDLGDGVSDVCGDGGCDGGGDVGDGVGDGGRDSYIYPVLVGREPQKNFPGSKARKSFLSRVNY